jgi:oligopeptide/dipeptide ABC transporter ATP-binding protein
MADGRPSEPPVAPDVERAAERGVERGAEDSAEPETEVILDVKDLRTYLFTERALIKAVDGVSFYLRRGETLGIVGESGSGKSITALSLLRMEPKPAGRIVGGEVWFHGEDLLRKRPAEMRRIRGRRISMILQDPQTSLNPVFTIGNQLTEAFVAAKRAIARAALPQAVRDSLRRVNIADPERRVSAYPHQLSGGMKQRVVGAIAIAGSPDIVIADEPTTSLDLTIQAQYLRLIKQLQEATGVAIIFITHDFGIVAKMCDRVAVMYAGKIVEHGPVRAIFNHPSHPYTQALINSVPKLEQRSERLYSIPGQPPAPGQALVGCRFATRCVFADDRCRQEYPPVFPGLSRHEEHTADCWRLEDPTWRPSLR